MRKVVFVLLALALTVSLCYAQTRSNPYTSGDYSNITNFTNIGVSGNNVTNSPGFIMMKGVGASASGGSTDTDATTWYYLWIDEENDLCMASHTTISAYASFPTGTWDDDTMPSVCTKVGGQS